MIGNPTEGLKLSDSLTFFASVEVRMIGNPTEGLKLAYTSCLWWGCASE